MRQKLEDTNKKIKKLKKMTAKYADLLEEVYSLQSDINRHGLNFSVLSICQTEIHLISSKIELLKPNVYYIGVNQ